MKVTLNDPPRVFETGRGEVIQIKDCARIALEPDELVTFTTDAGGQYDVARKSWGFYATPSLNGRLRDFGLRAALVKSYVGKYYVFLVERHKEEGMRRYMRLERNSLVRWLDTDEALAAVEPETDGGDVIPIDVDCMCSAPRFRTVHTDFSPPVGDAPLQAAAGAEYRRELFRCSVCGHFIAARWSSDAGLNGADCVNSADPGSQALRGGFDRGPSLPSPSADQVARVGRIQDYAAQRWPGVSGLSVLDAGSGSSAFLREMKAAGWDCTALDLDAGAARPGPDGIGVRASQGDFMYLDDPGSFDLITFNQVLEDVKDPSAVLAKSRAYLNEGGAVYVELPDGEAASREGFSREEFAVEHFHVFSAASVALLASRAGFRAVSVERLRERSTKYTLRAFLIPEATEPVGGPE